jgi:biopolymer transport protein ExbB
MRARIPLLCAAAIAAQLASPDGFATNALDQLFQETLAQREARTKLAEERAAQFRSASATDQQRMMQQATAQRDERKKVADAASDRFSQNELRINELNGQLREQATMAGLTELFGLARQVANDVSSTFQQSLITAQLQGTPSADREDFLRRFAADNKIINDVAQLERLWTEMLREIAESGKVARFTGRIVRPNGDPLEAPVIRVGPFTASSNGEYLGYLPALRSLTVLSRQPGGDLVGMARGLQEATSGYVPAVVDAQRGVLLGMYVERPNLIERINAGDVVVAYTIIVVGACGAAAFIFQLLYLMFARLKFGWQMRHLDTPSRNNPLGRVLLAFRGDPNKIEEDADVAELRISEAVLHEVPKLERFQALLRLAVAAGPLLGLIGTVYGMILTFQSITETGSSDPKLMARGIGTAMIATLLGLGIAVPLLFANAWLNSLSRGMVQILDEQSAGLLAESLERKRRA